MQGTLWISEVASALGLTKGEVAQLVASGLTALGGLAAAFAAWKAARISTVAVAEMRAARHQAIRPTFLLEGERSIRVLLEPSSMALVDDKVGGEKLRSQLSYECFRATNIGLGVAHGLKAYFDWDGPPLRAVQTRKVEEFLGRNGIELSGFGSLERGKIYPSPKLGNVQVEVPLACRPNETFKISISRWDIEALILKTLSSALCPQQTKTGIFAEAGDLNLSFISLSGEAGSDRARVSATGYLIIYDGSIDGAWRQASLYLSFHAYAWSAIYPQPNSNLVRLLWLARGRRVPSYYGKPKRWESAHRAWLRRLKRKQFRKRIQRAFRRRIG